MTRRLDFWIVLAVIGFALGWAVSVQLTLRSIETSNQAILDELRIHTVYIRGSVPEAVDHDRCGE